jgi:hypothetical protein
MKLLTLFVFLLLYAFPSAQAATSSIPSDFLKTVVSIEKVDDKQTNAIGTGFLLQAPSSSVYLVTARHVIDAGNGQARSGLHFRFNNTNGPTTLLSDAFLTPHVGGWVISKQFDIACRRMGWKIESDIKAFQTNDFLSSSALQAGAPAIILGFPMGLRSEKYAVPIARHGMVALADENTLMLDALVFPGNSGGPAFYSPDFSRSIFPQFLSTPKLIGIVSDYIPYIDTAISPQTGRPRISFEENSGLCHIVRTEAILDLWKTDEFREIDAAQPK